MIANLELRIYLRCKVHISRIFAVEDWLIILLNLAIILDWDPHMVLFWVLLGFDRNLDVFLIYRSIICILFFQLKDFLRRASVAQINIYGRVKFVRARAHEIRKRALVLIHPIICLSICILAFNLIG